MMRYMWWTEVGCSMNSQSGSSSRYGLSVTLVFTAYLTAGFVAWLVAYLLGDQHPLIMVGAADFAATVSIFVWSVSFKNTSMYDPYWSVAPVPIALYLAFGVAAPEVSSLRQLVVIALIAWWSVRLTFNWLRRWRGLDDEDWRYVDVRNKTGKLYWPASFLGLHLMPTVVVFLGCLALWPALATGERALGLLDLLAIAVTASAVLLETISDHQLHRFLATGPSPTATLDSGLWAWSRHPNYFGEVLFWWGLFLFGVAADPMSALWTWIGPVAMTALFIGISIPMMERRMLRRKPAYADRMRHVSSLIPWPPRRR